MDRIMKSHILSWSAVRIRNKYSKYSQFFPVILYFNSALQIFSQYLKCEKKNKTQFNLKKKKKALLCSLPSIYYVVDIDFFLHEPIFLG